MRLLDLLFGGPVTAFDPHGPIVLIAEDHTASILGALQSLRAAVLIGPDTPKLAEAIATARPAAVVIEVELTGTNGFLVQRTLKGFRPLRDVPSVLFSTEATEETFEQHRKLRSCADGYVHGNDPVAIAQSVREVL